MAKGRERTTKFYFNNEKEVMESLGLKPTKGSGSNWVEKEDGENDHVLAQLKSTDKESYKVTQLDLEKLEYHAMVANKIPMFIIQFLNKDSRYALVAIDDISKIAEYIETGDVEKIDYEVPVNLNEPKKKKRNKPKIKSNADARKRFFEEKEKQWEERKWRK